MKLENDRDTYASQVVTYNNEIAALEAPKYVSWAKSFVIPGNNEASVENINTDLVNNLSEFIVAYSDTDTFDKNIASNQITSFVNSLSVAEGKELTDYLKSLNSDSLIVSEGELVAGTGDIVDPQEYDGFTITSVEEIQEMQSKMPNWAQSLWEGDVYEFDKDAMVERNKNNIVIESEISYKLLKAKLYKLFTLLASSKATIFQVHKKLLKQDGGDLAVKYFDHFLSNQGSPLSIDIEYILDIDPKLKIEIFQKIYDDIVLNNKVSGNLYIYQTTDYSGRLYWRNQDLHFTYGGMPVKWSMHDDELVIYINNQYTYNIDPNNIRETYPIYAILNQEIVDNQASEFYMTGVLKMNVSDLLK